MGGNIEIAYAEAEKVGDGRGWNGTWFHSLGKYMKRSIDNEVPPI